MSFFFAFPEINAFFFNHIQFLIIFQILSFFLGSFSNVQSKFLIHYYFCTPLSEHFLMSVWFVLFFIVWAIFSIFSPFWKLF